MLTITNEQGTEVSKIKKEIRQLQERLNSMLESASSYSREKLAIGQNRLSETFSTLKDSVRERASHAYEAAQRGSQQAVDKSRHSIAKNPFTAILVAFLAGAAVTAVARWHKR